MPNLKLTQTALSLLGRKLREYKEAGLDQKGNCETWWKECERFYRNEAPEAPSERLVPFHVPFSQPRQDALTAQACTVIGKQEPYMLATNVGDSSRQDRLQGFVHTLWQAANFELQIRKASTIAGNINAAFYRLTPKKPGSEASGSQMAANVTERPGIQIDVMHGSDMSVFPASLGGIERAVYVGHRFYPRVKDVKNLQEQGVYYKNARVQGGQSPDEYDETGAFEQAKTYLSDYGSDQDQSQTELWNGCVRLDLSAYDSKQEKGEKWYLTTFADATQEILSLEPYDYSRPWYFHTFYISDERLFWSGRSVARNLKGLQDAFNKAHSAIYTASMRAAGPVVIGPKLDEKYTHWDFGEYLQTDEPVQPWSPTIHPEIQGLVAQVEMLEKIGDQVARISQNTTGAVAHGSTTATEQSIIAASVAVGLEEYISNFSSCLPAMAALTCEIAEKDFQSIGSAYTDATTVTPCGALTPSLGAPAPSNGAPTRTHTPIINLEELQDPVVWEPNGKSPAHTPQMKQQGAQLLVQMSNNPAFGYDQYELGTVMLKNGPLSGVDNLQIPKQQLEQQKAQMQQAAQAQVAANAQSSKPSLSESLQMKYSDLTPFEQAQVVRSIGINPDPAHVQGNEANTPPNGATAPSYGALAPSNGAPAPTTGATAPSNGEAHGPNDPTARPPALVGQPGGEGPQVSPDQEALRRIQAMLQLRAALAAGGSGPGPGPS